MDQKVSQNWRMGINCTDLHTFVFVLTVSLLNNFLNSGVNCGIPGYVNHGTIIGRSHLYEDIIRYQCQTNYTLIGSTSRKCQSNGQWSGETPICQGFSLYSKLLIEKLFFRQGILPIVISTSSRIAIPHDKVIGRYSYRRQS